MLLALCLAACTRADEKTSARGETGASDLPPVDTVPPDTGAAGGSGAADTAHTADTARATDTSDSAVCFTYEEVVEWCDGESSGPCPGRGDCWYCCGGRPLAFGAVVRPRILPAPRGGTAAAFWAAQAADEAASVHAFLRAAADLRALGAPAAIVDAHDRASGDEDVHAALCLAVASELAGRRLALEPFEPPDAGRRDLEAFALGVLLEGCLNETVAAGLAAEQALRARAPEVRRALTRIAADEARHAALAWSTARWALSRGGTALAVPLRRAVAGVGAPAVSGWAPDARHEGLGWLGARDADACARRVHAEVVVPCLAVLLGRRADGHARPGPVPHP